MAKGPAKKESRADKAARKAAAAEQAARAPKSATATATKTAPPAQKAPAATKKVGPPLLLVGLGFASVLISLPLISFDGIPTHAVGYVTGSVIPILVIGFVRRIDLDRRRSPYYVPNKFLQPALVVLAVAAIVAAGLHVWPIATELAS